VLEVQALAYIRGKSIDNTILIMEEAQNMSPAQMKTLLTRIGEHSKFIISGDFNPMINIEITLKVVYMML
jgi:predicted ribonuclease YlaK